ncbi:hypothetical protein NDU88_007065 [Pleurodeles waltl]|uniref:Uncharacterized protein n=1 Tax=Pleurodeles waltl TaxID=8319 RepID=A0AAV7LUC7_PLEWA|nr:hypothetical protein NDU88_007065 [Pleurodeles waltl]
MGADGASGAGQETELSQAASESSCESWDRRRLRGAISCREPSGLYRLAHVTSRYPRNLLPALPGPSSVLWHRGPPPACCSEVLGGGPSATTFTRGPRLPPERLSTNLLD